MFAQTIVDNVPGGRGTGARETVEREAAAARMRAGPLRLLPVLELWGVGWNSNAAGSEEDPRGDLTANALGGLRAVVPVGTRLYFRGFGGLSYAWFAKEVERRHVGFSWDGSVILALPRVSVAAGVAKKESVTNLISEVERPIFERTLSAHADVDVTVVGRLSIFGQGALLRPRYVVDGLESAEASGIRELERNDAVWGGGLRYRIRSDVTLVAAAQETQYRFLYVPERDADGTGYIAGVKLERPRLFVDLSGGWREFRPVVETAEFRRASGAFGAGRVEYEFVPRSWLRVYGARRRNESAAVGATFFVETFGGVGATIGLGDRGLLTIGGFAELGTNRYDDPFPFEGGFVRRSDDVFRFGASLGLPITHRFRIGFFGSRGRYSSNVPGFDRSVYQVSATISFVPPEVAP